MNFDTLRRGRQAWNTFKENHPQFPAFLRDVGSRGIPEGTEILITLTYPDGQTMRAGLRAKPADRELIDLLREVSR